MRAYAGIGSRETPEPILRLMEELGAALAPSWVLRSGGAPGADSAFEAGADRGRGAKEIFLPFAPFNGRTVGPGTLLVRGERWEAAQSLAAQHHPAWVRLKFASRAFHTRNCFQVLGESLEDPVRMVLCFTPGGSGSGGTGQALRVAHSRGIPVIDLGWPENVLLVRSWMREGCMGELVPGS